MMDESHFIILQFLSTQLNPTSINNFPLEVQNKFLKNNLKEGSLSHELQIVLQYKKEWIKSTGFIPASYSLTDAGKHALKKECVRLLIINFPQMHKIILQNLESHGIGKYINITPTLLELFPFIPDRTDNYQIQEESQRSKIF